MICAFFLHTNALAQSQDPPKYEVAAEFTSLERDGFGAKRTEPGFGGRFTFNLNRAVALETATYYLPKRCFSCRNNGRVTEVLGGVKVGKRFDSWGIFAKARPGIMSFSKGEFNVLSAPPTLTGPFDFAETRLTAFATDIGGVLEFYPSKRIVTRFDAGDTIVHFTKRTTNSLRFDQATNSLVLFPITTPARTTHNFQFMASIGFRF